MKQSAGMTTPSLCVCYHSGAQDDGDAHEVVANCHCCNLFICDMCNRECDICGRRICVVCGIARGLAVTHVETDAMLQSTQARWMCTACTGICSRCMKAEAATDLVPCPHHGTSLCRDCVDTTQSIDGASTPSILASTTTLCNRCRANYNKDIIVDGSNPEYTLFHSISSIPQSPVATYASTPPESPMSPWEMLSRSPTSPGRTPPLSPLSPPPSPTVEPVISAEVRNTKSNKRFKHRPQRSHPPPSSQITTSQYSHTDPQLPHPRLLHHLSILSQSQAFSPRFLHTHYPQSYQSLLPSTKFPFYEPLYRI